MRLGSRQFEWMFRLAKLCFAGAIFITSIVPSWALAQSSYEPWDEPLNLSHSGFAKNPAFVIDSGGVGHVLWQDNLENYVYARFDGDQWSTPQTTGLDRVFDLPITTVLTGPSQVAVYGGPNPVFLAGPGEYVYAVWISTDGELYASKVENENFGTNTAWGSRRLLTMDAAAFAAAVDARGELHVAYLRMLDEPEKPSGIYYTRSKNTGLNWDKPLLLYQSPYLSTLGEGEGHLSITVAGTDEAARVYVAWDNRRRKQVFLAQSFDGGTSWDEPMLVAGPAPDSGLAGPFNVQVAANQNSVVLVWQSGQPGGACSQMYQSSSDAGDTWSNPQPMIDDLLGCAESNQFVKSLSSDPEGQLYFLTETKSQVLLTAWNGLQWSQPQAEPILSKFEEPEIYTDVVYSCHSASLLGERLYVVGCDQGLGGDVWVTSRDLGSDTSGLKSPVWSRLSPVTSDNLKLESIELLATDDGLIHAFFSQDEDPAIYYTNWDGDIWSRKTPVLDLLDGEAGWPVVTEGPGNELFLVVPNDRGSIYFSRAISSGAVLASSWSTPALLKIYHDGQIGSVDVASDATGTVYVAYSVPVNEERGIYLVQSKDQGTTWSDPLQVFDGTAAGFDFVGAPSLLTSATGLLHIIWKVQTIQGDAVPQPLSLYHTRSEDSGQTFDAAELAVDEPVAWREILTDGKDNLHLLWQPYDTLATVWDQASSDGGATWEYPQGLPYAGKLAAVAKDPAGGLHLVGVDPGAVGHWFWDGSRWQSESPPGWLVASQQSSVEFLAAAVNKQGKMMVVLAQPTGEGDVGEMSLLYSIRTLKLSPKTSVQDTPTQTPLSPTLIPVTTTPESLSTPALDSESATPQGQTGRNETSNRIPPLTLALLPVALLLLGVLGFAIRQAARAKER